MTKVKICGIKTAKMAEVCVRAGADYIGLVFAKNSIRCVDDSRALDLATIAREGGVEPVAVFYDATVEEINAVVAFTGITLIQLHGLMPTLSPGLRYIMAVTEGQTIKTPCDYVLYDNALPGSGIPCNHDDMRWSVHPRVFLAGGLNQHNVVSIIDRHHPYGVDVSSGVESSRGHKDAALIQAFISTVKEH